MKLVQCKLQSENTYTTAWLENKVKIGNLVTLKDTDEPQRLWKVLSVSKPIDSNESTIKTRSKDVFGSLNKL
jgi:hypothetical protein